VNIDPDRLQSYKVPIMKVIEAVRNGNSDVGGRLVEFSGTEYMVRGHGYVKSVDDIGNIVLLNTQGGVAVRVKDVGTVVLGPDIRRASPIGMARVTLSRHHRDAAGRERARYDRESQGEDQDLEPGLPPGVKIVTAYDRSDLILRSIANLKGTLTEEMVIVALVIFIFLWHIPSSIIRYSQFPSLLSSPSFR